MKIAIVQMEIVPEAYSENLEKGRGYIRQAAEESADLILFPETSFSGFLPRPEQAASHSREIYSAIEKEAKTNEIAVGFGCITMSGTMGENHYYILDPAGKQILDYIKIHPFSYTGEDRYYRKGESLSGCELQGNSMAAVLCYDLRFPELFRVAAKRGNLLLVPANWLEKRHKHYGLLLQARAIENQAYVLGVNCTGKQGNLSFRGGSRFVNPEGEILLDCGENEGLYFVSYTDDTEQYRDAFPTTRDIRRELYGKL